MLVWLQSTAKLKGQRSQSSLGGFPVLQQCGAAGKMEISGSYISPYFITDQMSLTCKKPLLLVARDVDDKVLSWLIWKTMNLLFLPGGELVTTHSKFSPKVFGRAKRVIVTYEKMAIFGGHLPR
ncbi:hypothetical protein M0R45_019495 [Rubus argutus]|uniref:Uncharacterized protein n=1 Tax=Rubus argutus TaxID=59490 RepID=A0AAW1X814_RUBAR